MAKLAVDVERLSRDEQLELLDQLWESLGRDPEALPLTDEQKRDLDQRLDELEREGPSGLLWDEALGQIRSSSTHRSAFPERALDRLGQPHPHPQMTEADHLNDTDQTDRARWTAKQRQYLERQSPHADFSVLTSNEMWGQGLAPRLGRTAGSA